MRGAGGGSGTCIGPWRTPALCAGRHAGYLAPATVLIRLNGPLTCPKVPSPWYPRRTRVGSRVRAARSGSRSRRRQKMPGITVGIDGSAHSTYALEWAMKEAAVRHAPVTVITVHSVPASGWTGSPILLPQDTADLKQAQQDAEELTLKATSQLGGA